MGGGDGQAEDIVRAIPQIRSAASACPEAKRPGGGEAGVERWSRGWSI